MFGKKTKQSNEGECEFTGKYPPRESDRLALTIAREDGSTYQDDLYELLEVLALNEELERYSPEMAYLSYWVGSSFLSGENGAPRDTQRGTHYVYQGARAGCAEAQFLVALSCLRDDRTQAIQWLQKAAKQNHLDAKKALINIQGRH